jgi:AcrR family transcriptional regulator
VARIRSEVSQVALDLFEGRGFDAVTVDDIADAAGISRRTFFRYFESKEGAVLPFEEERLELLRRALAARPDGEPVLLTVRRATLAITEPGPDGLDRRDALRRLRIVQQNPSVHAQSLEIHSRWEAAVRDVLADHLGTDPSTSVTARVVAGATIAAVRAAVEVWLATGGEAELGDLLAEAYDVLTAGLAVAPGR